MAETVTPLAGERQKGETAKAVVACNDYLRMGPSRSLAKVRQIYVGATSIQPPTKHLRTLQEWSARYGWVARAEQYDAQVEAEKNARRKEIMEEGLALDHERTKKLKRLAELLFEELVVEVGPNDFAFAQDNVWLPDVKQIGGGEYAEKVDIVRFNASLFEQMRGLLDDIAKETGGRRQRVVSENLDYSKLTDVQLARIAAGEDPLQVVLSDLTSD